MSVRVRYAPSPTGSPHVGNIRTALFDYLLARHFGGVNIVRIEDTDRSRYVPGCEEEILESLKWIGASWEEGPDVGGPFGPYRQSERKAAGLYDPFVQKLLDEGYAYWAFDTSEELAEMREFQQVNKQPVGYFGGMWRDATSNKIEEARAAGKPGVIRLKMPHDRKLVCRDAIRGRIEFEPGSSDDPVLIKGDGMPTYHFAAMVDDHLMQITHIIRGEEWITSAPKHVWLFEALGCTPPEFVHVPVIKGKDGSKLSKRHGDTRCLDYRAAGYLPEALANFIALIGWSPGGDREILTPNELIEAFTLDGLQPSPGVFDADKLKWMNGHYLRQLPTAELVDRAIGYAASEEAHAYWTSGEHQNAEIATGLSKLSSVALANHPYVASAIALEQERVGSLAELGPACRFFMEDEPEFDQKAVEKWFGEAHVPLLFDHLEAGLTGKSSVTHDEAEALVKGFATAHGMEKLGPVVHPTRVALTGKTVGPGLFELMAVLGPERMRNRLARARTLLD